MAYHVVFATPPSILRQCLHQRGNGSSDLHLNEWLDDLSKSTGEYNDNKQDRVRLTVDETSLRYTELTYEETSKTRSQTISRRRLL